MKELKRHQEIMEERERELEATNGLREDDEEDDDEEEESKGEEEEIEELEEIEEIEETEKPEEEDYEEEIEIKLEKKPSLKKAGRKRKSENSLSKFFLLFINIKTFAYFFNVFVTLDSPISFLGCIFTLFAPKYIYKNFIHCFKNVHKIFSLL